MPEFEEEAVDFEQLKDDLVQVEDEIQNNSKGLAIAEAFATLRAMPEFELVFDDAFVQAYRVTAVANIARLRPDAQNGVKVGLITRATFVDFCDELTGALPILKEEIASSEAEAVKLRKLIAG